MYRYKVLEPSVPEIDLQVEKVYSTYAYFYTPKYVYDGEYHQPWELIYADYGEVIIDTPEYSSTVKKGQVFLHTPNEKHKIRANNVACSMYFISFDCPCEKLYDIAHTPIPITPMLKNYIMTIVDEGLTYFANKNYVPPTNRQREFAGGQVIKNLLELLLIELIRLVGRTEKKNEQVISMSLTEKSVVEQIIDYMQKNLRSKIQLNQISLHIGYSVPRICALFKNATGTSIMAYFNKMRIEEAKKLMAETDISIQQISQNLGFDTPQYFSLLFKKVTGMPPSQYAAHLKLRNYQNDEPNNMQFLK